MSAHKPPPPLVNLSRLPEDRRIEHIAAAAMSGKRVAFIVEDHEKANRYMVKLTARYPALQVEQRLNGPIKGTRLVTVIVTKKRGTNGPSE